MIAITIIVRKDCTKGPFLVVCSVASRHCLFDNSQRTACTIASMSSSRVSGGPFRVRAGPSAHCTTRTSEVGMFMESSAVRSSAEDMPSIFKKRERSMRAYARGYLQKKCGVEK